MNTDAMRSLYLDLLKKSVSGLLLEDPPKAILSYPFRWSDLWKPKRFDAELRDGGKDWPSLAQTMIGGKRMNNLERCIEDILRRNVPGDLIETGVWRGGATIFMRGMLKAHGVTDRAVWVADSFAGLPAPDVKKYPKDRWWNLNLFSELAVSENEVRSHFTRYGLLDDQVHFLKGWFRDTLPSAPIDKLALLRLDGDLYESTTDALTHLYPRLSVGGYVIIDDYVLPPCAQAVADYRTAHAIDDEIVDIDGIGAYWMRTR